MYRRNLRRIFGASLALCCLLGALSLGGSAAGDIFVNGSADVLPGGIGSAYAISGDGSTAQLGLDEVYVMTGSGLSTLQGGGEAAETPTGAPGHLSVTGSIDLPYDKVRVGLYYNKTTQKGLVAHFSYVADRCSVPMIIYNVPSRTGIGVKPATYLELSKHPNINGVKEASGNIAEYALTRSMCGDELVFWSGNDSDTVPMMSLGAMGVISVASNIIPAEVAKLCQLCEGGDFRSASELYFKLADFFDKLFIETNPIPIKTAMNLAGMGVGKLRLPLVDMAEGTRAKLIESMHALGIKTV